MSDAVTRGVRVQVEAHYVPDRSMPEQDGYFFAYQVTIRNEGDQTVQLISRHWIITDGMGRVQEVRGAGVVGEQPRLEPGQDFRYTSACPLGTAIGTMHGSYQMVDEDGQTFDVEIAPFTLAVPTALN